MKTAEIWEEIFDKYHILEHIEKEGFFEISSKQIGEFHEARLMAKYDFSSSQPKIFKDNHLGILPITRGKYIIGKFELYAKLKDIKEEPEVVTLPSYIETIDPDNIYSEANALHVGLITGMLDKTVGEHLVQSISGRMSTDGFDFDIKVADEVNACAHVKVDKPQIEIDGGYESKKYVVLVEAKNRKSEDFIVRQLYYPYRYWADKVSKPIIPIFFLYDSGVYTVYKYTFKDKNNYNSLDLVDAKKYVVEYANAKQKVYDIFCNSKLMKDSDKIPFPQADSFTKVINMLTILDDEGSKTKLEIAELLDVVSRQGYYYADAGIYLGLVEKDGNTDDYGLSHLGKTIINQETHIRNSLLCECILKHRVFYLTLEYYYKYDKFPSRELIKKYIIQYSSIRARSKDKTKLPDTINRRISTVLCWTRWMLTSHL